MSINLQIRDKVTNRTQTVTVDFVADLLSNSISGNVNEFQYFFTFSTGARDLDNKAYFKKIILSFEDLALNNTYRSKGLVPDNTPYISIKDMLEDYMYDYIYGHLADQFGSGVTYKAPMKYS